MKYIYIIFILMLSFHSRAQSGTIIYEAIISEELPANTEMLSALFEKAKKNLTQIKFELQFNSGSSLFSMSKKNGIDFNKAIRVAKPFIAFMGETFQNRVSSFTQCDDILENIYLVKNDMPNKWKITNDTKTIDGYLCYKATLDETRHYKGKTFPRSCTAWFCPKLPFSFGPNGYGGLPGMILELQNYKCIYGAKKILYSSKKQKEIKKPEGIEIVQEEFDAKIEAMYEE